MKVGPRFQRWEVNIATEAAEAKLICPISACRISVKGENDPRPVPKTPSTTKIDKTIHATWRSCGSLPALANQIAKAAIRTATRNAPRRCQASKEIAAGVVGIDGTGEIGRSRLVTMAPAMRTRN